MASMAIILHVRESTGPRNSATGRNSVTQRKTSRGKTVSKAGKGSLVENINRRKRAGKSRPRSKSTVSDEAYAEMRKGWPRSRSKRGKRL